MALLSDSSVSYFISLCSSKKGDCRLHQSFATIFWSPVHSTTYLHIRLAPRHQWHFVANLRTHFQNLHTQKDLCSLYMWWCTIYDGIMMRNLQITYESAAAWHLSIDKVALSSLCSLMLEVQLSLFGNQFQMGSKRDTPHIKDDDDDICSKKHIYNIFNAKAVLIYRRAYLKLLASTLVKFVLCGASISL